MKITKVQFLATMSTLVSIIETGRLLARSSCGFDCPKNILYLW